MIEAVVVERGTEIMAIIGQRSRAIPSIALSGTVLANVNLVMHQPLSVFPQRYETITRRDNLA